MCRHGQPAASIGNCVLEVERNAEITSTYVDPDDSADTSRADVLVDPYGLIFDSSTGAAVNGARVRLLECGDGRARRPCSAMTV